MADQSTESNVLSFSLCRRVNSKVETIDRSRNRRLNEKFCWRFISRRRSKIWRTNYRSPMAKESRFTTRCVFFIVRETKSLLSFVSVGQHSSTFEEFKRPRSQMEIGDRSFEQRTHPNQSKRVAISSSSSIEEFVSFSKDELATTTRNYEGQIAAMSDLLASMNEKIVAQNESIDKLQQQIHSNQKVNWLKLSRRHRALLVVCLSGRQKEEMISFFPVENDSSTRRNARMKLVRWFDDFSQFVLNSALIFFHLTEYSSIVAFLQCRTFILFFVLFFRVNFISSLDDLRDFLPSREFRFFFF